MESVSHVPRPVGTSDAFIEHAQKTIGFPVLSMHEAPQREISYLARITYAVSEAAPNFVMHIAHEPSLVSLFAQSPGRTPPFFEYLALEVPGNPDSPEDVEVIPPAFLEKYAKYERTGSDLDYVRKALRLPYMRGATFRDFICRTSEYTAPVPVNECYVQETKQTVFVAACAITMDPAGELLLMTIVEAVAKRLLYWLRLHHEVDTMPDAAKRKRFGTVQYAIGAAGRSSYDRVIYMQLAPALSRKEDMEWRHMVKPGDPSERFVQQAPTPAYNEVYMQQDLQNVRKYDTPLTQYGKAPNPKEASKKIAAAQVAIERAKKEEEEAELSFRENAGPEGEAERKANEIL
jgi:hypothetical protein